MVLMVAYFMLTSLPGAEFHALLARPSGGFCVLCCLLIARFCFSFT